MTISTEVRKAGPFVGNDSASAFPFAFKVFKVADLIVVRRQDNIGEETTLVLDSDYHVTLNGNQDTTPGGVVTLVAGALASGFTLVVSSELPYLQPTDLTNQGGFYPKVITNALDRLTIFCQQLAEITGRTLKLPITAPTNISAEIPLPNPSELIAWNETGTGLTTVSPQSLVTSIAYGSATADLFAGDGVTTTFLLSTNPASVNNLDVSVGGFSQRPVQGGIGDYSWNGGASITFAEPPPAPSIPGDKNVLVRYMQAIPVSDSEALHAQTREALRRSYAEAGYNLVDGSFETGGTLASTSDVLLLESAGTAYAWTGAYPAGGYDVAPGIDPTVVPGFVLRKNVLLRDELAELGGASLIGPGVMSRGLDKFSIMQGQHGEEFSSNYTRGIAVQLNSPLTGGAGLPVNTAQINLIEIKADRLNVVDDTSLGTKVDGLMVYHRYGGAGTKGGRHAIEGTLSQNDITDSTNTDRNYVGVAGVSVSSVGDGGTSSADAKGTYYGGNFYGMLNTGATFCAVVTGAEFNAGIKNGASANIRSGIQIGSTGDVRAGVIDAAVMIGGGPTSPTWRSGIHFGKQSGGSPLDATSRAMRIDVDRVGSVISISPTTVVDKIIDHPDVILTPSRLAMKSSAALVEIGSDTTPGSTQLRFRTSGTGTASDSAIIASGGGGTENSGNFEIKAGTVTYSCSQRPNVDNAYDYGAPSFRGRTAYFGTGAINTSDEREKTIPLSIDDAVLDAWGDVQLITFQWLASIQQKSEDVARWHFGVIAQQVRDAFAARGLDGTRYGLLCYDEWEASDAVFDEDGNVVREAMEAGNRWGIRPDQCLFLEAALQRRNHERLLKRVEALERKV